MIFFTSWVIKLFLFRLEFLFNIVESPVNTGHDKNNDYLLQNEVIYAYQPCVLHVKYGANDIHSAKDIRIIRQIKT